MFAFIICLFIGVLCLAFGYAFVAYLNNAPIIDEDEQYAALMAVAQEAHRETWTGETA